LVTTYVRLVPVTLSITRFFDDFLAPTYIPESPDSAVTWPGTPQTNIRAPLVLEPHPVVGLISHVKAPWMSSDSQFRYAQPAEHWNL
jgi:hypothetical protein